MQDALRALKETCSVLGMPLDPGKEESPVTVLSFLGLELDTVKLEIRLPGGKLLNLRCLKT